MAVEVGKVEVVTAAASTGVELEDLKTHLRIEHRDEDERLLALLRATENLIATQYGIRLLPTTVRIRLDRFPSGAGSIRLPCTPVTAIDSVLYDPEGGGGELSVSAGDYTMVTWSDPPRIELVSGASWPSPTLEPGCVRVTWTAGWADRASIPEDVQLAVRMLGAHLNENSEAYSSEASLFKEVPFGVSAMLEPYAIGHWSSFP